MQNWCTNRLEVYGPAEEVSRFSEEAESHGELVLDNLIPSPDALTDDNQTSWREKNWGTKAYCLVHKQEILRGPEQITYTFDTADSPPLQWVDTVAAMYPKLFFDLAYHELVGFYAGSIAYKDGEAHSIEEYTDDVDVAEFMDTVFNYDMSEFLEANSH